MHVIRILGDEGGRRNEFKWFLYGRAIILNMFTYKYISYSIVFKRSYFLDIVYRTAALMHLKL